MRSSPGQVGPPEVISENFTRYFVLVLGEDAGGTGYPGGAAGAGGDVLKRGPALG
jgi:hypothetical protein